MARKKISEEEILKMEQEYKKKIADMKEKLRKESLDNFANVCEGVGASVTEFFDIASEKENRDKVEQFIIDLLGLTDEQVLEAKEKAEKKSKRGRKSKKTEQVEQAEPSTANII